jgi:peptidoglycan LD-endopeptidase LytH
MNPAARLCAAVVLLVTTLISAFASVASGGESSDDLKARMNEIQAELDATTARIEDLRSKEDALKLRVAQTTTRIASVQEKKRRMMGRVVEAAQELYKSGSLGALEALISSEDFGDLVGNVELLSQVSERDQGTFVRFARTQDELTVLEEDLRAANQALAAVREDLTAEADRLQAKFDSTEAAYEELLAAARRRAAAEAAARASSAPSAPAPAPAPAFVAQTSGNMACPVAGPVSFSDTWGAPRSGGRSHQGVDMMASYGTPVAAITNGSITYAGYGSSAGNWQILSGDDGHQYWYMHNQSNIVTGGRVRVGQQIATVGDTGNATGIPHLHFEYHPGGGAAVNPTPLVSSLC